MKPVNFDINNIYKYLIFFVLLYTSIIISLVFNEDSTGGAFRDYVNQKKISEDFAINFKNTFLNFDQYSTRHSPVLIIFLSFFEKIKLDDNLIRLIHLHLCLLLPVVFFSSLINKLVKYLPSEVPPMIAENLFDIVFTGTDEF